MQGKVPVDSIVQLAALALTLRGVYSLSRLLSPRVTRSEPDSDIPEAEVEEFRKFPPALRRQLLRYGSRWQEALFEDKS